MSKKVPTTMRAVVIDEWKTPPYVKQIPVPKPKKGEVLIKVMAAPIHPADNAFLRGQYSTKRKPPTVPGTEASGIVVAGGGGLLPFLLTGQHVNCIAKDLVQGSWAEYCIADANTCGLQKKNAPFEVTCAGITNPLTCCLMLEETLRQKHKGVVVTAACSNIGRMIHKHFKANGLNVICIVRDTEEETIIKEQDNAKYVLNTSTPDWEKKLKIWAKEQKCTCLWDVIAGPQTGKVLSNMPSHSIAKVFGILSLQPVSMDAKQLIFKDKQIQGFWLRTAIKSKSMFWKIKTQLAIRPLYFTSLKTAISKEFPMENIVEAVDYYKHHMNQGKVILRPGIIGTPPKELKATEKVFEAGKQAAGTGTMKQTVEKNKTSSEISNNMMPFKARL